MNTFEDIVDAGWCVYPDDDGGYKAILYTPSDRLNIVAKDKTIKGLCEKVQAKMDAMKPKSVWDVVKNDTSSPLLITKDYERSFSISRVRDHEWITLEDEGHNFLSKAMNGRYTVLHPRALRFLDVNLLEEDRTGCHITKAGRFVMYGSTYSIKFTTSLAIIFLKAIKEGWIDLEVSDDSNSK